MYHRLFRWFPKRLFSHGMGVLASLTWPKVVLNLVIRLYVRAYGIDMTQFVAPEEGFATFNEFFARPVRPGVRPIAPEAGVLVSPVDGKVTACSPIRAGTLLQAKGMEYSLADLLGNDARWKEYDGGSALTLYLSPKDYHRIHAPCAGQVTRYSYIPGELWTVGPAGFLGVPGLFARNERLVTWIATSCGELALIAVGATVVGRTRAVYPPLAEIATPGSQAAVTFISEKEMRRRGLSGEMESPYPLEKGAELARFELGSTVILLLRPGEGSFHDWQSGDVVRMGEPIGTVPMSAPEA